MRYTIDVKDITKLKQTLKKAKIPLDKWTGTEGTKTINDLHKEILSGDSELQIDPNSDKITRNVKFVNCDIEYIDTTDKIYKLKEEEQITYDTNDNIVNHRKRNLEGAVAEKMHASEDYIEAAYRGIFEEIGIKKEDIEKIEFIEDVNEEAKTGTYPGLNSNYIGKRYKVTIYDRAFNPHGYIETVNRPNGNKRVSRFVWEVKEN